MVAEGGCESKRGTRPPAESKDRWRGTGERKRCEIVPQTPLCHCEDERKGPSIVLLGPTFYLEKGIAWGF